MKLPSWPVRVYRWCRMCEQKAAVEGTDYCGSCEAQLEMVEESLRDG